MFDYLWWLLPNFFKKHVGENSIVKSLFEIFANAVSSIKTDTLKTRLSAFIGRADTLTDYYELEGDADLLLHGADRMLPKKETESIEEYRDRLLNDPYYRPLMGTKEGMKYYLEHFIPQIRVDFIYEIYADDKKWIVLSNYDQGREATFNLSYLFIADEMNLEEYVDLRKMRIYSNEDLSQPEFLFWVKVYNEILEDGSFTIYPEKILEKIDRLKPGHTRGFLAFNLIDNEFTNLSDGQVFIGETINIEGQTVMPAALS